MDDQAELVSIQSVAGMYHSEALGGANEQYHRYVRDAVIPEKGGLSALELGCGKGLWTRVLCERYETLDVVDASGELVQMVSQTCKGGNIATHVALAEGFLSTTKKLWQHIYITFLLEHVSDPVALLKMAASRCLPGGLIFVAVPNAASIHRVLAVRAGLIAKVDQLSEHDRLVGHRRVYTEELLRSHVRDAGLSVKEVKAIGLKPLTLKQLGAVPAEVVRALCASGDLAPHHAAYLALIARPGCNSEAMS